jgi:hypothetical protein
MVCRLLTCCGISLQSPVNIRIAGGQRERLWSKVLNDTPIRRLADSGVNKKLVQVASKVDLNLFVRFD